MPGRNDESMSKLSTWIPKDVHKRAKMLAAARDIDLQDLVCTALEAYLTSLELRSFSGSAVRVNGDSESHQQ